MFHYIKYAMLALNFVKMVIEWLNNNFDIEENGDPDNIVVKKKK